MINLPTILITLLTATALYEFAVWGIKQDSEILIGLTLLGAAILVYWVPRIKREQPISLSDKRIIIPIAIIIILIVLITILDTP